MHRKHLVALCGAVLALVIVPSAVALAASGSGTSVTVRVEGRTRTLLAPKVVQTQSGWITRGGAPTGSCSAGTAAGALDVATRHSWNGKYFTGQGIFVNKILGENESGKKFFFEIYVNNVAASSGACGIRLKSGDKLLFAAVSTKSNNPHPTALRGPSTATQNVPFSVRVVYFNAAGKAKPLAHARITGGGVNVVTNSHGSATINPKQQGPLVLRTSPPGYVRAVPLALQVLPFY